MMTRAQAVSQDLDGIGSVGSYYTRLRSYTDRQRSQVAQVASSSEGAEEGDATKETSQDTNKLISQVFGNSLGQRITRWMIGISESENGTVNPLISMKSLGDNIIGGTELALVGYVGVKAVVGGGDGSRESMAGRAFSVVTLGYGDAVIARS